MTEIWKPIAGYEGLYEVSDQGRVRSLKFNKTRILKAGGPRSGYLRVILCKNGICKNMRVHRLVASAFIPNPNNLETVNHKDENKWNNNVSNLEWMSQADNTAYSQPQLAERPVQQFDKQGNLLATFPSTQEARRRTGIAQSSICACCNGRMNFAGGFVWRYA